MTTDRDRYRVATAAGVMTVAAIAAVVSFLHIRNLALAYGESQLEADLLPLSIDGVVAQPGRPDEREPLQQHPVGGAGLYRLP